MATTQHCGSIWRGILTSLRPSATIPSYSATSAKFSTSTALAARNKGGPKPDSRIKEIRYFLLHPLTPRPLRFSRERALRHWTIHRAWQLYQSRARAARERELERQYNSMREACEALRLMDSNGVSYPVEAVDGTGGSGVPGMEMAENKGAGPSDIGRLYRKAMHKGEIWKGVPIEYARIQTDMPPTSGWDGDWTR